MTTLQSRLGRIGLLAGGLVFGILLGLGAIWFFTRPTAAAITALNIGQGDAILVETPHHRRILVDGGPNRSVLSQLGMSLPMWSNRLDAVVPTHFDADHIGGLPDVIDHYRIGQILVTGAVHQTDTAKRLFSTTQTHGIPMLAIAQGMHWELDGVGFTALWPPALAVGSVPEGNTAAIVLKVAVNEQCGVLTSDIDETRETAILSWAQQHNISLDCDYLKVAHHGSRFGSSPAFLQAVTPKTAVISVGKNSYGHPHPETLERLQQAGTDILRTDKKGTVKWKFESQ